MGTAFVISVLAAIGLGLEIAYDLGRGCKESSDIQVHVLFCGASIGSAVAILGLHAIGWSGFGAIMVMCVGFFAGAIAGGFVFDHFTTAPRAERGY